MGTGAVRKDHQASAPNRETLSGDSDGRKKPRKIPVAPIRLTL